MIAPERDIAHDRQRRVAAVDWLAFLGWLAVSLYFAASVLTAVLAPIGKMDEVIPLIGARQVVHGQIPGIDFWSFYPPLFYYVVAAGFRLLGETVLVPRLIEIFLFAWFLFAFARLLRDELPDRSLVSWAVLLAAVGIGPDIIVPFWPALALSFLSLMFYLKARRETGFHRSANLVGSGLLAGITLLMRINFGFYVPVVVFLDLLVLPALHRTSEESLDRRIRAFTAFLAPFVLLNVVFYGFVYGSSVRTIFDQSVLATAAAMGKTGFDRLTVKSGLPALALPILWLISRLIPVAKRRIPLFTLAAGMCALAAVYWLLHNRASAATMLPAAIFVCILVMDALVRFDRAEVCFLFFYTCILHYYFSRADRPHLAALWPCVAILISFLVPAGYRVAGRWVSVAFLITASVAMLAYPALPAGFSFTKADVHRAIEISKGLGLSDSERLKSPGSLSSWLSTDNDELKVLSYILPNTAPNEPIYVGLADHSRNDYFSARLYWLADRAPAVRHAILDGSTMDAPQQAAMISDLGKNNVRYVIQDNDSIWGVSSGYVGSHLLDDYIAAHFQEVARFGDYRISLRRP